jgi:hypothetical protein
MGDGAKEVAEMFAAAGVTFDFVLDEGLMVLKGVVPSHEKPVAMVGVVEKVRGVSDHSHPTLHTPHSTPSHSTPLHSTPVHLGVGPTTLIIYIYRATSRSSWRPTPPLGTPRPHPRCPPSRPWLGPSSPWRSTPCPLTCPPRTTCSGPWHQVGRVAPLYPTHLPLGG